MSESKVLLFQLLLQFSILCYKSSIGYKVQFLVALLVVIEIKLNHSCDLRVIIVSNRTNTIKQGILYWTCTGLAVEVIGLASARD